MLSYEQYINAGTLSGWFNEQADKSGFDYCTNYVKVRGNHIVLFEIIFQNLTGFYTPTHPDGSGKSTTCILGIDWDIESEKFYILGQQQQVNDPFITVIPHDETKILEIIWKIFLNTKKAMENYAPPGWLKAEKIRGVASRAFDDHKINFYQHPPQPEDDQWVIGVVSFINFDESHEIWVLYDPNTEIFILHFDDDSRVRADTYNDLINKVVLFSPRQWKETRFFSSKHEFKKFYDKPNAIGGIGFSNTTGWRNNPHCSIEIGYDCDKKSYTLLGLMHGVLYISDKVKDGKYDCHMNYKNNNPYSDLEHLWEHACVMKNVLQNFAPAQWIADHCT